MSNNDGRYYPPKVTFFKEGKIYNISHYVIYNINFYILKKDCCSSYASIYSNLREALYDNNLASLRSKITIDILKSGDYIDTDFIKEDEYYLLRFNCLNHGCTFLFKGQEMIKEYFNFLNDNHGYEN